MFVHHVNIDKPTRRAIIHVQGCIYVTDLDLSSAKRREDGQWVTFDDRNADKESVAYARRYKQPGWTVKFGDCCGSEQL